VREALIIDRDTKRVELFRLAGTRYEPVTPDVDGGIVSDVLGVRFATVAGPRLRVSEVSGSASSATI
jgi:hypothetical protein